MREWKRKYVGIIDNSGTRLKWQFSFNGKIEEIEWIIQVLKQLKKALAPALSEVSISWGTMKVQQAPQVLPPLFDGQALLVYAFLQNETTSEVVLSAETSK